MVRGQSITFGSRPSQVTRRGTSRNCHAETYISLSPGACQRGRLRHLFCDLDISALYPLPRIPSCLSRLSLSRPPSPHPLLPPCLPRSERERERAVDAIRISGSPCLSTACRPPLPSSVNLLLARILATEEPACASPRSSLPFFHLALRIWIRCGGGSIVQIG